jgi:hypothetical protein
MILLQTKRVPEMGNGAASPDLSKGIPSIYVSQRQVLAIKRATGLDIAVAPNRKTPERIVTMEVRHIEILQVIDMRIILKALNVDVIGPPLPELLERLNFMAVLVERYKTDSQERKDRSGLATELQKKIDVFEDPIQLGAAHLSVHFLARSINGDVQLGDSMLDQHLGDLPLQ